MLKNKIIEILIAHQPKEIMRDGSTAGFVQYTEYGLIAYEIELLVNQDVEKRIAERMPSEKVDAIIERINEDVEKPMVTAQFGDMWKSHAIEHYNLPDIVNIAWRQGRRALLLEKELRSRLTCSEKPNNLKTEGGGE